MSGSDSDWLIRTWQLSIRSRLFQERPNIFYFIIIHIEYGHSYLVSMLIQPLIVTLLTSFGICDEQQAPLGQTPASIQFSSDWAILGPFQIGTRGK